jgi:hypothetical protein
MGSGARAAFSAASVAPAISAKGNHRLNGAHTIEERIKWI